MTPAECYPDAEDVDSTTLMEEDGSTAEYVVKTHADALHRQLAEAREWNATYKNRIADLEAKLERVRALAEKYEEIRVHPEVNDLGHRTAADTARRLRECLGE